jgi:hypothetical protein
MISVHARANGEASGEAKGGDGNGSDDEDDGGDVLGNVAGAGAGKASAGMNGSRSVGSLGAMTISHIHGHTDPNFKEHRRKPSDAMAQAGLSKSSLKRADSGA